MASQSKSDPVSHLSPRNDDPSPVIKDTLRDATNYTYNQWCESTRVTVCGNQRQRKQVSTFKAVKATAKSSRLITYN